RPGSCATAASDLGRMGGSLVAARYPAASGGTSARAAAGRGLTSSSSEAVQQAARAMLPVLRARQEECEALGRLPDETNTEFVKTGFYRILQPSRFGGCELDMATFFPTM